MLEHITLLACNATALPIADDSLDGVFFFRSLHHFDNVQAIVNLATRKVRPGGFVAFMCEPVGDIYDAHTVDLITRNINEQVFSAEQYRLLIERAGLTIVSAQLDWGFSLKVVACR